MTTDQMTAQPTADARIAAGALLLFDAATETLDTIGALLGHIDDESKPTADTNKALARIALQLTEVLDAVVNLNDAQRADSFDMLDVSTCQCGEHAFREYGYTCPSCHEHTGGERGAY
jgi:hypothetical protein